MKTIEEIIQKRLEYSYSIDKGSAAAAARDIAEDIQAHFRLEVLPYLEETPSRVDDVLQRHFDVISGMARNDIQVRRETA